ncbi:hypothetical protein BaRGS_00020841 [Batillaria attramentaria]|uniref:Uncharacterized protein n=1 Tax=Batillaria attramentaria TaxID=370345 RepID=A0ABD0KLR8_9CAEN
MMLKIAVVLLVLALVSGSEARRGEGRRRGQRPAGGRTRGLPPTAQLVSSWQRTLVDATARELAYTLPDQDDQLYILSKDVRQLKRNDYKPSKTLYDFTGGTSVVVMKVKKLRGCVLLNKPTDLTKAGVTADLEALNGTTVAASTPVTMYLSNDALQPAQATDMQARTAVRAMCGRKPIRPATDVMRCLTDMSVCMLQHCPWKVPQQSLPPLSENSCRSLPLVGKEGREQEDAAVALAGVVVDVAGTTARAAHRSF